jgi:iron complex transport system ATP-binding protein
MTQAHALAAFDLAVGWQSVPAATVGSFELPSGQILVLAGPNGAGKSTVLATIARAIRPLSGCIRLDGVDIAEIPPRQFARHVSYVPQSLELTHDLTVGELVALGRTPHQQWWSWAESTDDSQIIAEALATTGCSNLSAKKVRSLSGGERQRVAIATALAQKTEFMLLDEPTAHLDFKHQIELVELLLRLRGQGLGILLVIHDLALISRLADRVLLLDKPDEGASLVAASGSPQEVLNRETLRRVYQVEIAIVSDEASGFTSFMPVAVDK